MKKLFKNKTAVLVILVALVVGVAYVMKQTIKTSTTPLPSGSSGGKACTMEAKICPDGSSVGRSGPNCEFAPCPTETNVEGWNTNSINELNMTVLTPPELTFTKDVQKDDAGKVTLITLYIQKGQGGSADYYQLYGIYQPAIVSAQSLEELKGDLIPETVVDAKVDGRKAVSGQIKGQRNRLATYVLLDGGIMRFFTAEPTMTNKVQTEKILQTMKFSK